MRKKKKMTGIEKLEGELKKEYKFLKRFKDKNENHLLFAAFLIVMTSMVVVNTLFIIDYVPSSHNRNSASAANNQKILTSLQKATSDAYEVMVSNVTVTDKADPAFALAPTDTMLIMDISITNLSTGIQQLVPSSQLYVRDQQGGFYMLHPSSYVANPLILTTVSPGNTVKGQLSFGIPKILAHPLLYVDLGWKDNAPAVIDVMK